ncbi:MAG TPA: sugar phosphate nucleotidyltransferase [Candidatus Udaeobacter sp.]|jgi:mannose-1-phosphate guanylyltransferase|nr:sugar phosphate nucleotidyltransferase [Candidatus Udaeobacter sp.]
MKRRPFSVIMAGGKGTRFWPLSRSQRPKQLLKILSPKTLIRETADRVLPLSSPTQTLVVTVAEQLDGLSRELRMLPRANFLAEPEGRNTAPCIGLAALEVVARDPTGIMLVLPADHWIPDVRAFRRTLGAAMELANNSDNLITIGIRPAYPETGYGYIMKGKSLRTNNAVRAYQVKRFKEKPSEAVARQLIRRGSLWNSGIFVWRASTLLELIARYQTAIATSLDQIRRAAKEKSIGNPSSGLRHLIARAYKQMPSVSIDHGVLEKVGSEGRVLTLEADFGWSDVGSWAAVHRMMHQDENGNAGNGKWLGVGAKNCLVQAGDRLVVLLGMQDAVVVDTADALLVGDLKRSQDVRELVDELKRKGYGAYTIR